MKNFIHNIRNIFKDNTKYESVTDVIPCTNDIKTISTDDLIKELNIRRENSIKNQNTYEIVYKIGKSSGNIYIGDQCGSMPEAKCHACGLGYKCYDPDCPNDTPSPTYHNITPIYKI